MTGFPDSGSGGFPGGAQAGQSPFGPPDRSPGRAVLGVVSTIGLALFVGLMFTVVVGAAWPGAMKLLAPVLCSDATPDPFVVVDRYQVRPGETAFTYTMYCVGPAGAVDEIGWAAPFGLMTLFFSLVGLVLVLFARGVLRSNRQRFGIGP